MGKKENKVDIDPALKEMLEDHPALLYMDLKWNIFLVTLVRVPWIANGQIGKTGNHVTENTDGETR